MRAEPLCGARCGHGPLEVWLPRLWAGIPPGCSPEDIISSPSGASEGLVVLELLLYQQAYLDSAGRWPLCLHIDCLLPPTCTAARLAAPKLRLL